MKFLIFALLAPTICLAVVRVPPAGKVYLGTWLDTANIGSVDGDRPVSFNERMKLKCSGFQYAQNLPIDTFPAPDEQIKATGTDAFMLLTVYPRPTPWNISDADIDALGAQCKRLNNQENRRLLIRFAPEMNGDWNYYGQAPVKYKQLWTRVATVIKRECPLTSLVWAPNSSAGYPFTGNFTAIAGTDEFRALDTNGDGIINALDDAFSPYYPGDDMVDWVGMSVYHYGISYPWLDNSAAEPGKFERLINGGNFYQTYAVAKGKPLQIAEGAASFHTNTPRGVGVGELEMKRSFWRQWLTNETFLKQYDQIKMFNLFEFRKDEEQTNRDFRLSVSAEIRNAFLEDLATVKNMYIFANDTNAVVDKTGTAGSNSGALGSNISGFYLGLTLVLSFFLFV
jgi:hypothetical protein